jgi:hypothetical protein
MAQARPTCRRRIDSGLRSWAVFVIQRVSATDETCIAHFSGHCTNTLRRADIDRRTIVTLECELRRIDFYADRLY